MSSSAERLILVVAGVVDVAVEGLGIAGEALVVMAREVSNSALLQLLYLVGLALQDVCW